MDYVEARKPAEKEAAYLPKTRKKEKMSTSQRLHAGAEDIHEKSLTTCKNDAILRFVEKKSNKK